MNKLAKHLSIVFYIVPAFVYSLCNLTSIQKHAIGMQIWQNEAGKKYDLLAFWNKNEPFPSLGICHFIWYPVNKSDIFTQSFPELLDYFKQRNITFPAWLEKAYQQGGAPWPNRATFEHPKNKVQIEELKKLLYETIDLQIDFVIEKFKQAWQRILASIPRKKRVVIKRHYERLTKSPQGIYALIDYCNFKGEGVGTADSYNGKGWGLLQVLETMPAWIPHGKELEAFAKAAKTVLEARVLNAPEDRQHEKNWLPGWKNRIDTYVKASVFESI